MRARTAAACGIILALAVAVIFLALTPPVDDFDPLNPYWNGISGASSSLKIRQSSGFSGPLVGAPPAQTALLVIAPYAPFDGEYVEAARQYLLSGGMIVVMDDFGTANSLLEGLGATVRIDGRELLDPLYMFKSQHYPKALSASSGEIALDRASAVTGSGFSPLAESSAFSYLDTDGNGRRDEGEPEGPFAVAAAAPYGAGKLVVVSDSSLIINSVAALGNNTAFLKSVVGSRAAYLDQSVRAPSAFSQAKSAVTAALSALSSPEARYLLAIGAAAIAFAINWDAIAKDKRGRDIYDEELSRVAEEHPSWDAEELAMIQEERRRAYG